MELGLWLGLGLTSDMVSDVAKGRDTVLFLHTVLTHILSDNYVKYVLEFVYSS